METGGEGIISKRKRVRGKIGNPSNKPELKLCNCAIVTDKYASYWVNGVASRNIEVAGVWRPYPLNWPPLGTEANQRIGKRIKVRYLRLKGFAASSPFLIQQVRYRIVLYRTKKHYNPESIAHEEIYDSNWLKDIYHNFKALDSTDVAQIQEDTVTNYYMSFLDQQNMKDDDCKRRVLIKGMLKPSPDIGNFQSDSQGLAGTINTDPASTYSGTLGSIYYRGRYLKHFGALDYNNPSNMSAFFPIDLTVELNDNVDVEEYRYIIMIESDCGVGQTRDGDFTYGQSGANYMFRFIPQIYYFDD